MVSASICDDLWSWVSSVFDTHALPISGLVNQSLWQVFCGVTFPILGTLYSVRSIFHGEQPKEDKRTD